MPIKGHIIKTFEDWIKAEDAKKHSMAVKYIEENVDLVDVDLQKFMDNCPTSCQSEVYAMLLKAGIDMTEYVRNSTLKKWDMYIHDINPQFQQYYAFDSRETLNKFMEETITWKPVRERDWFVLDTFSTIEEA